jgi:hypothetical protein
MTFIENDTTACMKVSFPNTIKTEEQVTLQKKNQDPCTNTSGAILSSTFFNLSTHSSNLVANPPICSLDNTRGCTHVINAF